MVRYHVVLTDRVEGEVVDQGIGLCAEDIKWAKKQLWAPDAFKGKDGKCYLCFPARDHNDNFRLGMAVGDHDEYPFVADDECIPGSLSFPAVCPSPQRHSQMTTGRSTVTWVEYEVVSSNVTPLLPAMYSTSLSMDHTSPRVGSRSVTLSRCKALGRLSFIRGNTREMQIIDQVSKPMLADDHERRFFEAKWMHKHDGTYYFSYSTGDTHLLAYAIGSSPYGPFTHRGHVLDPVIGWTTYHSIVEHEGKLWLFYHDCSSVKGVDHLRRTKVKELWYGEEGAILMEKPNASLVRDTSAIQDES